MNYQQGNVRVDDDFARFGSKSYAIDKINTVDVQVDPPKKSVGGALALIGGVLMVVIALGGGAGGAGNSTEAAAVPAAGTAPADTTTLWIIAVILLAFAAWRYTRKRPSTYHLRLQTSSSEVQAFSTHDPDEIGHLRDAIEAAMARRARA